MPAPPANYPVRSRGREVFVASIRTKTNDAANPLAASLVDDDKLVTTVTREAVGRIKFALRHKWRRIDATYDLEDITADVKVHGHTVTEGTGANAIEVLTISGAVAADLTAKPLRLLLVLRR